MKPLLVRRIRLFVSVLILTVLAFVVVSYQNRSSSRAVPHSPVPLLKPDIVKSTEKVEYTEMQGNKVAFKVSAEKVIQTAGNKNLLEGIVAHSFGEDGSRHDSIESARCEYDPNAQTVRFEGRVKILTQEGTEIITESLFYSKSKDVAETDDRFSFRRSGFAGEGRGFAYDFREGVIRVRQGADFHLDPEQPAGSAAANTISIHSEQAVFSRDYHFLFRGGSQIRQGETRLSAGEIEVQMDARGEQLQSLRGREHAALDLATPRGGRQMGGNSMQLQFASNGNMLQSVLAEEQAFFKVQEPGKPELQLNSHRIDLQVDSAGAPQLLRASEGAEILRSARASYLWMQGSGLLMRFFPGQGQPQSLTFDEANVMRLLQGADLMELWSRAFTVRFGAGGADSLESVEGKVATVWQSQAGAAPVTSAADLREIKAEPLRKLSSLLLEVHFTPDGKHPRELRGTGDCRLEMNVTSGGAPAAGTRVVTARDLLLHFVPESSKPSSLTAGPQVQIVEELGSLPRRTQSDSLLAEFDPKTGELARVEQKGSFHYEQGEQRAGSRDAVYQVRGKHFQLDGDPHLWDTQSDTTANAIEILGDGEELRAQGKVKSTFKNASVRDGAARPAASRKNPGDDLLFVTSAAMTAYRSNRTARYQGSVKALQGFDYVKGDEMWLDQDAQTLRANGNVEVHFTGQPGGNASETAPFHATSSRLIFKRSTRNMEFLEKVQVISSDLRVDSARMLVDFDERMQEATKITAFGSVQLVKGEWHGKGETGEYRTSEEVVVLSGNLAEIWDASNRRSAGRRLTIHIPDDKIIIES